MNSTTTLRAIRNQDHFVFKRLFDEMYADLVLYAHGYLFQTAQSEDVVQEVFIHLWEHSNEMDIKANLKGYLYAMVRNRCLTLLRSVKITDDHGVLETPAALDAEDPAFFGEEQRSGDGQLMGLLEKLPQRMRTIVTLRFVNGYKYSEIAEELGVSVNTIKTQLRRAKVKLGQLMAALAILIGA